MRSGVVGLDRGQIVPRPDFPQDERRRNENLSLMSKRHTIRLAWGLAALLAAMLLGGSWMLFLQLWPHPRLGLYCSWVATHHGKNVFLNEAHLRFAVLRGVDLRAAALGGADLTRANLAAATLRHAVLQGARLQGANLRDAELIGIDLRGADLRGADLTATRLFLSAAELKWQPGNPPPPDPQHPRNILKLTNARYDAHTRWPAGFDPRGYGAARDR